MYIGILIFFGIIGAIVIFGLIQMRRLKNTPKIDENKKIINLDDKNFQSETRNTITLVDFWAEWCAPCRMMSPIMNELANEVDEKVKICKLNVDTQQKLAMKFSVRSIPTMIILKNGKEVSRFVGVKPKNYLLKQLSLIN